MKDTITGAAAIYVASLVLAGGAFLGFTVRHATGLGAVGFGIAALASLAGLFLAARLTLRTMTSTIAR